MKFNQLQRIYIVVSHNLKNKSYHLDIQKNNADAISRDIELFKSHLTGLSVVALILYFQSALFNMLKMNLV